jgi:hypothetical protein
VQIGETYLLTGGHLWVVCTPPDNDGSIVCLNMTSWKPGVDDESCVIIPADHSWVKQRTVIAYERGKILSKADQDIVDGMPAQCPRKTPVSAALLRRIQDGAIQSDLTPQRIQKRIRAVLGMP